MGLFFNASNMNASTTTSKIKVEKDAEPPALRVAIQGVPGAFHDIAARHFFSENMVEAVPSATFADLTAAVEKGEATDVGLMAIENTLAGSILWNYRLMLEKNLKITGEIYLRIRQNLMALPGQTIEDLTEVHSHPMAIEQCRKFFDEHPHIRLVEAEDTALSAKFLKEKNKLGTGAIASSLAAEMYGLAILNKSIETNKQNYTRFLVLERPDEAHVLPDANKVSICFAVSHEVGSLHRVLSVMAAYDLNLTKIQSFPIAGKTWEYFFFVDFVCGGQVQWEQGTEALRPLTTDLRILGVYPQGKHVEA